MNAKAPQLKTTISEKNAIFLSDVIAGLTGSQKTLPCKYFYDQYGSELFEQICELNEYYVTRTEMALLHRIKDELAKFIGAHAAIIEPGAGAGTKIQMLLDTLEQPELYVPLDISAEFLQHSAQLIKQRYPSIRITEAQADFTDQLNWPADYIPPRGKQVAFFPGSTIGNFAPNDAVEFLNQLGNLVGEGGGVILGIDLVKDKSILEAAYDDREGITAAFNLNILNRIQKELGATINIDQFEHLACFNEQKGRVEMHLVSKSCQTICIADLEIEIAKNERIHTENSYKYTIDQVETLAELAGFQIKRKWLDDNQYFCVCYMEKRRSVKANTGVTSNWF